MKIFKEVTLLEKKEAKGGVMYKFIDTAMEADLTDNGERWIYCKATNLPLNQLIKIWIDSGSAFLQIGSVAENKTKK